MSSNEDGVTVTGRRWRVPMVARNLTDENRASTPLELLFDLTFVVAVAAAGTQLAHAVADNHPREGLLGYLMVFFAIWWAWMNFTWFASAYDCDDSLYRLLTLLQMGGVLVLAAGVPAAFNEQNFVTVTIGYVIMRLAMLLQWSRAARNDAKRRATAIRYIIGTVVVQIGWLVRLGLPGTAGFIGLIVLVLTELTIPIWAERKEAVTWHPHHIAERYGLFTIIVLGECVLAVSRALEPASNTRLSANTILVGAGGLLLLFAAWWMYFLNPAGTGLTQRRDQSFWWGYGHYGVFASLAALGSGLEVVAETLAHPIKAPTMLVAFAVAVPVICFMLLVWTLHFTLDAVPRRRLVLVLAASAAVAAIAAGTGFGLTLPWAVIAMSLPVATVVAFQIAVDHRNAVTN